MKKQIVNLLLFLSIYCSRVCAQNSNLDFKYSIKVYNITSFDVNHKDVEILRPSLAFQKQTKKRNIHEVELNAYNLTKRVGDPGYDFISSNISARYEFILNFNKSKESKVVPSLGFAVNPYYSLYKTRSSSSSYLSSNRYLGLSTFVTPRLTYYRSSKLFFDINIPFCLFDTNIYTSKYESGYANNTPNTTTTLNISEFPMIYNVRFGIGLKI